MKIKALPPALRMRKRYIAFCAEGDRCFKREEVAKAIFSSALAMFGEAGVAQMNLWLLDFDEDRQEGFVVCSHLSVDRAIASLSLVGEISGERAHLRSLGVSGTVKALKRKFLNRSRHFINAEGTAKFMGKEFAVVRESGECCDAVPVDEELAERLRHRKMRFIGLTKRDLRGE
ncbi:Rpp14/Pop5 family protein [Candidatus Pyrohabitans sp.]